jgi:hypothetical protein
MEGDKELAQKCLKSKDRNVRMSGLLALAAIRDREKKGD